MASEADNRNLVVANVATRSCSPAGGADRYHAYAMIQYPVHAATFLMLQLHARPSLHSQPTLSSSSLSACAMFVVVCSSMGRGDLDEFGGVNLNSGQQTCAPATRVISVIINTM